MTTYDVVWSCPIMYDDVWTRLTIYHHIRSCLTTWTWPRFVPQTMSSHALFWKQFNDVDGFINWALSMGAHHQLVNSGFHLHEGYPYSRTAWKHTYIIQCLVEFSLEQMTEASLCIEKAWWKVSDEYTYLIKLLPLMVFSIQTNHIPQSEFLIQ